MAVTGHKDCLFIERFPVVEAIVKRQGKDIEDMKISESHQDKRIGKVENDHARFGVYRAIALAVAIPTLTYLLPRIISAIENLGGK